MTKKFNLFQLKTPQNNDIKTRRIVNNKNQSWGAHTSVYDNQGGLILRSKLSKFNLMKISFGQKGIRIQEAVVCLKISI